MKKLSGLKSGAVAVFVFALFCSTVSFAQQTKPLASPRDSVSGKIGNATIEINYGSPAVKGRKIWGGLESYGKVWRAGANEATTFKTDRDIKVEGQTLPAGTYSFFVIPTESYWTIIFNKTAKQWGAYKYDEAQDALRVTVRPRKVSSLHERLRYVITGKGFELQWEYLEVPVSVK